MCRTHESDAFYGMRVCVGGTAAAWMAEFLPGSDAAVQPLGVSFVGVFGRINPPRSADMLPYIFRDVFVFSGCACLATVQCPGACRRQRGSLHGRLTCSRVRARAGSRHR